MKIVYCLNSVRGLGGIQKVTLVKANALAEIAGNEVYVIVTDNWAMNKKEKKSGNQRYCPDI